MVYNYGMVFIQILRDYLHWHYTRGVVDYVGVWGNFIHFFFNLFSISLLLRTLISPWRRMQDETKVGITDFSEFFASAVVNVTMRIIGLIVRLIFLSIGLVAILSTVIFGALGFVLWFIAPIGIILLFIAGAKLLITT